MSFAQSSAVSKLPSQALQNFLPATAQKCRDKKRKAPSPLYCGSSGTSSRGCDELIELTSERTPLLVAQRNRGIDVPGGLRRKLLNSPTSQPVELLQEIPPSLRSPQETVELMLSTQTPDHDISEISNALHEHLLLHTRIQIFKIIVDRTLVGAAA